MGRQNWKGRAADECWESENQSYKRDIPQVSITPSGLVDGKHAWDGADTEKYMFNESWSYKIYCVSYWPRKMRNAGPAPWLGAGIGKANPVCSCECKGTEELRHDHDHERDEP